MGRHLNQVNEGAINGWWTYIVLGTMSINKDSACTVLNTCFKRKSESPHAC